MRFIGYLLRSEPSLPSIGAVLPLKRDIICFVSEVTTTITMERTTISTKERAKSLMHFTSFRVAQDERDYMHEPTPCESRNGSIYYITTKVYVLY